VLGELGLDGSIAAVAGVLPAAIGANAREEGLICPAACGTEAAWASPDIQIIAAKSLIQIANHFKGTQVLSRPQPKVHEPEATHLDLRDIKGQESAKRALEIAAAGGHHLLLTGPPGAGKTMLARRLAAILPPLSREEVLEVSSIWSVAGLLPRRGALVEARPFRAPHHTISVSGLIGGGSPPRPGEVTLAHRGVLFLDELPEFQQHVLESLRQPVEDGRVTIARAAGVGDFPARFQLVAAANPCRRGCPALDCCLCTPAERDRYLGRLSGPLLDRIDLHVELPALAGQEYADAAPGDNSATIRTRVVHARECQRERGAWAGIRLNSDIPGRVLRKLCPIPADAEVMLATAMTRLGLSARGHDRVVRVARTIADLTGADRIAAEHCAEALQYRGLDRRWRA
jgi:magnesium chelatase family protein